MLWKTPIVAIDRSSLVAVRRARVASRSDTLSRDGEFLRHPPYEDDAGARTHVTITESSWQPTTTGAEKAFRTCEGWTGMLAAMKVWLEHGIALREGFYV